MRLCSARLYITAFTCSRDIMISPVNMSRQVLQPPTLVSKVCKRQALHSEWSESASLPNGSDTMAKEYQQSGCKINRQTSQRRSEPHSNNMVCTPVARQQFVLLFVCAWMAEGHGGVSQDPPRCTYVGGLGRSCRCLLASSSLK